jgi:hypothetical protein
VGWPMIVIGAMSGDRLRVESSLRRTFERSGPRLLQIIAFTQLIVDSLDHADCIRAKGILRRRVRASTRIGP